MGICVDRLPAGPAVLPVCRGYPWGLWSEADVGKGERGCGQPRRPDQVLKHLHPCLMSKCISLLQVSVCCFFFFFFFQSSPPPVNLLEAGVCVCVCVCPLHPTSQLTWGMCMCVCVPFILPHSSPGVVCVSVCPSSPLTAHLGVCVCVCVCVHP